MVPREQTAAGFLRAEASELLFEMLDEREQQGIGRLKGIRARVLQERVARVRIAGKDGQVLIGQCEEPLGDGLGVFLAQGTRRHSKDPAGRCPQGHPRLGMVDAAEGQVDQLLPEGMAGQEKVQRRLVHAVAQIGEVLRGVGEKVSKLIFMEVEPRGAMVAVLASRPGGFEIKVITLFAEVIFGRGECILQIALGEEHGGNGILVAVHFLLSEPTGCGNVFIPATEEASAVIRPVGDIRGGFGCEALGAGL